MSDPKAPEGLVAGMTGGAAPAPASTGTRRLGLPLAPLRLMAGDVVFVDMPSKGTEQAKPRPWVILSDRTHMNQHGLGVVIGVPLTTKDKVGKYTEFRIRVLANEISTFDTSRLRAVDCVALTEHVRSFSTLRISGGLIGKLTPKAVSSIRTGVQFLLAL